MKKLLLIITLLVQLMSCTNRNFDSNNSDQEENIVLVFKNAPEQSVFSMPSGIKFGSKSPNYIFYINESGVMEEYRPGQGVDTLVIELGVKDHLEIKHQYRSIDALYYLFQKGDTVVFTYDSLGLPFPESKTSKQLTYNYNFFNNRLDRVSRFGFSNYSVLTNIYFKRLNDLKRDNPIVYNTVFKSRHEDFVEFAMIYEKYINNRKNLKNGIDTLFKSNKLSKLYYNYYLFQLNREDLFFKSFYTPSLYKKDSIRDNYVMLLNDSLIGYISYHNLLVSYLHKVEFESNGVNLITNSNGSYYDSRIVFNNLISETILPSKTKKTLLFYCLEDIIENFNAEDIKTHLNSFIKFTEDSVKYRFLLNKHKLDFNLVNDLILTDVKGEKLVFSSILKELKGKVLYIDFWASWCAPCRASMPDANELREEYKGKDVVFLYLALNDKETDWKKAINDLGINANCENYFIKNPKTSKFVEDFNISSIPRYMLFDKTGNIVHKNAPGPSGEEIRKLLNGLHEQ